MIESLADGNLHRGGPPPFADTVLINGTNKNRFGGGRYSNVKLTPGKKHRLRLINTAVDNSVSSLHMIANIIREQADPSIT